MTGNHGVLTVDCQYIHPLHAAAYLVTDHGEAAFMDNNTNHAVPHLLEALRNAGLDTPDVRYIIITHLHFDHAGGTGLLAEECPHAEVLCHPIGVRHLAHPERLVNSVKRVYGEARFAELYGDVKAIPEGQIKAVEDGEARKLGERTLTFMHTPGHAKHHICIHDDRSRGIFTGDMFGIMCTSPARYVQPCLLFSSAPTDFEPAAARESIARLRATGADRVFMTHFGEYTDLDRGQAQLIESLDGMEAILAEARRKGITGPYLQAYCEEELRHCLDSLFRRWEMPMRAEDWAWLAEDIRLDAMGLAFCAEHAQT